MEFNGKIWLAKADEPVYLEPNMANRHGFIAGASGTGKTITLKVMAESFAQLGVPVFLADIKGDLAGMCKAGLHSESMQKRITKLNIEPWRYRVFPTEFWDVYGEYGLQVRTSVSEMGPMLLSRLMGLSDVQSDVLNLVFKIADDHELLLIDIKDLKAMIRYISENRAEFSSEYGNMSAQSLGAIQRSLISLEDEGGDVFFGEPSIDINDWIRHDGQGRGYINILHCVKLAQNPTLYATFMLFLMSELYEKLPERGDLDKPEIVFFFDEAHMLFSDAPKVLVQKIEQVVKLIRSKGVGIYFISQSPSDIPDSVLAQLSNRVQHALRAYTPSEQKAVKVAAQTFRTNPDFDTQTAITELGVGEALISCLDEAGVPQVVQRAFILPPQSRMGTITDEERANVIQNSVLKPEYGEVVDNFSAYEYFQEQASQAEKEELEEQQKQARLEKRANGAAKASTAKKTSAAKKKTSMAGKAAGKAVTRVTNSAMNTIGREIGKSIVRGIFGSRR